MLSPDVPGQTGFVGVRRCIRYREAIEDDGRRRSDRFWKGFPDQSSLIDGPQTIGTNHHGPGAEGHQEITIIKILPEGTQQSSGPFHDEVAGAFLKRYQEFEHGRKVNTLAHPPGRQRRGDGILEMPRIDVADLSDVRLNRQERLGIVASTGTNRFHRHHFSPAFDQKPGPEKRKDGFPDTGIGSGDKPGVFHGDFLIGWQ